MLVSGESIPQIMAAIAAINPLPSIILRKPKRFNSIGVKGFKPIFPSIAAKNNPVSSYANSDFYSVHTFKFINKANKTTLVKWRFIPQDGVKRLSDDELKVAPTRFLDEDIMAKTKSGPVRWDMFVTIGESTDEQTNPTVYWPADRKQIKAGVLTLTLASPQQGGACEKINFDPLVMAQGIAPTNDPVLLFRSPAYADSYAKRLTGR